MRNIDIIKSITIFLKVIEYKSFSSASNFLNLAVSAVSTHVSQLEQHLGCTLLVRTTRTMHLTAEGKYFRNQFLDLIQRLDGIIDDANILRHEVAGEITITTPINSNGLGISIKLMEFMERYPDVKIIWRELNRNVDLIKEGYDLAIRVGNLPDSSLIARHYSDTEVLFVANPEYLKKYGTPKHPKELNWHECIIELPTSKPCRWNYQDNKRCWVNVSGKIESDQSYIVAKFAASGKGIARLPAFVVQHYIGKGKLVPILRKFQSPPLPVSIVYPVNRMMNATLKALIDFLSEG